MDTDSKTKMRKREQGPLKNYRLRPINISSQFQSLKGQILFGLLFFSCGLYPLLGVFKLVPMGKKNAPDGIIILITVQFVVVGTYITILGALRYLKQQKIQNKKLYQSGQPWEWDYNWNSKGIGSLLKGTWGNHFIGLTVVGVFNAVTYWLGWEADGPGFKIPFYGMLFFDFLVICMFWGMVKKHFKYGATFLHFHKFPFRLGSELKVTLSNMPRGPEVRLAEVMLILGKYNFEKTKERLTGNKRSEVVVDELYSDRKLIPLSCINSRGDLDIQWEIPHNSEWSSKLSDKNCTFWQLVVYVDQEGADYKDSFLLPIY